MKILMIAMVFLLASGQAMARDRIVKCKITSANQTLYKGKCKFMPDGGGSFTLAHPRRDMDLTRNIMMVSVSVLGGGYAEVRGLTTSGNNSRWGEARRSSRDRACWKGDQFQICAW
ncbi:MAG: hypothetical protein QM493_09530 [Sulfurovum sp.]